MAHGRNKGEKDKKIRVDVVRPGGIEPPMTCVPTSSSRIMLHIAAISAFCRKAEIAPRSSMMRVDCAEWVFVSREHSLVFGNATRDKGALQRCQRKVAIIARRRDLAVREGLVVCEEHAVLPA